MISFRKVVVWSRASIDYHKQILSAWKENQISPVLFWFVFVSFCLILFPCVSLIFVYFWFRNVFFSPPQSSWTVSKRYSFEFLFLHNAFTTTTMKKREIIENERNVASHSHLTQTDWPTNNTKRNRKHIVKIAISCFPSILVLIAFFDFRWIKSNAPRTEKSNEILTCEIVNNNFIA